ncbi:hypothetical protein QQF64_018071 [Cirrhinus molitorella]|uniref:UPAR/Ly6 domain-containing protein n=1 Tax=Cirrhinus molitorella TaxID=172907 RepID=A0ABR3LKG2_9TELE
MDLQITVCLLFILFAGGHSFSCHQCSNTSSSCNQASQCPTGISNCLSATATANGTIVNIKSCAPAGCPNGSINFGTEQVSSLCCNTDLCNVQDAPDPRNNTLNEGKCYYCDGQSCSKRVNCAGSEDRCFSATVPLSTTSGNQSQVLKGCVSKSICNVTNLIPGLDGFSCCEGFLCNNAKSVTQSFLFLCCSLLFFILLH